MTHEMQDTVAKISGGELMAIGAKYHLQCLTAYRYTYRARCRQNVHQELKEQIVRTTSLVRVATEGETG